MEDIVANIMGGLVAGCVGLLAVFLQERHKTSELRKTFIAGICDDLTRSIKIYRSVEDEWEKTKNVWLNTINEIKHSRGIYDRNRDYTLLIKDEALRQELIDYYFRSSQIIDLLTYQIGVITTADAKFLAIRPLVKMQNPAMSDAEVDELAAVLVTSGDSNYVYYNQISGDIENQKAKLTNLIQEAKDLLQKLQPLKNK